jgi:hypothetical protein
MWWLFVPVCETTTIEATALRGSPLIAKAEAMPIIAAKDDWAGALEAQPLRFPSSEASYTGAPIRLGPPPYAEYALGGQHIELHIADQWWLYQVQSLDGNGCQVTADKIELIEIDPKSSGPELYMHIVESCVGRSGFALQRGDRLEVALICGLGATGTPSCVDMSLGLTTHNGYGNHHSKLEIDCTGTVITTEWRRDHGEPLSHRRDQLVFP